MSSNQKKKLLKEITEKARDKVTNFIKPRLIKQFSKKLSLHHSKNEWKIESDLEEPQNLLFHYPSAIAANRDEYIQSVVKLEFGARGDTTPSQEKHISPYIFNALNELFDTTPSIKVNALTAERTFWEKVTLLHAEHHRKSDKPLKARMFRHYYDMAMLEQAGITNTALNDISLLTTVVKNKQTFFPSAWANYEIAKIGSMKLQPNEHFKNNLKQDCNKMSEMFFGIKPNFDEIMDKIRMIEERINKQ